MKLTKWYFNLVIDFKFLMWHSESISFAYWLKMLVVDKNKLLLWLKHKSSFFYLNLVAWCVCWIELFCYTGVQIVDICLSTRPHNGGLISLQELCTLLRQRRKSDREAVSEDDCLRAISKLKVLRWPSFSCYGFEIRNFKRRTSLGFWFQY